jgi:cell wall assembly regulator SMI1
MSVTKQWRSLMGVLQQLAPVTAASFQPGASARSIDRAEETTGYTWPAELREWFTLQNGQVDPPGGFAGRLLARQGFFSLDRMLEERLALLDISQHIVDNDPDVYEAGIEGIVERNPNAGTTTDFFLPSYVPISGVDGLDNFCDTRPGPLSGCIAFWAWDAAGVAGSPLWSSISDMLAAIESYIGDGPPEGWKVVIDDGAMHWEVDVSR